MAKDAESRGRGETRQVLLHVNFNDAERLNYVLNNAENIFDYYGQSGTPVDIRIIAHGPGLHMFREDTSPVKERIAALAESQPSLSFAACSNTKARMTKAEGKAPVIVSQAEMVPSGIVDLIERQRAGWTYIKP